MVLLHTIMPLLFNRKTQKFKASAWRKRQFPSKTLLLLLTVVFGHTLLSLKAAADKKQIQWGKIIVTESGGNISKIECDPEDESGDGDKFEVAPNPSVGG